MKRLALVLLPALALAAPDPEGLGTWIVPRVAFDCRLFEVLPGKAATVPDGFVPAGRAVKWKRGTIPAGMLRSFFDGSFDPDDPVSDVVSVFSAFSACPERSVLSTLS